jgi:hypothetical protein
MIFLKDDMFGYIFPAKNTANGSSLSSKDSVQICIMSCDG